MLKIINPYPGFESGFYRPYVEDEADLFFGREKDISTLKLKIRQRKLISLIGEPKMGKTSLLRSGIIPNLRQNNFEGYNGSEWKCIYMMPESKPIHSLAKALVNPANKISDKIKPSMEEDVYKQLQKNDYGLVRVVESIIGERNINILIVIDDFIDLFNTEIDKRERSNFLKLIYRAYQEKSLPLFFVTSFNKEDFKDPRLRQDPKLYKALNMGIHKINFLDNVGLEKAIIQPATKANSQIAVDLGKEMMMMLLQDSDQLRKLQLLMSRTWMEWKRNHKDKTVSKAHYFRATGQKSKAVAKGLMKKGKISVDHLESLAKESAKADNSEMAKADYNNLTEDYQLLFKRIIPHLIDDSGKKIKAINIERKKAGELLGITMEELGALVTQIPTIIAMDKKNISINDISIFDSWDEIRTWIRDSNLLKMKFIQIADAAILHYRDGIDVTSVISRSQYKELFQYIDTSMITPSWAMAQHDQFELGIDFIEKLVELYGSVELKSGKAPTRKKMSFGSKKAKKEGIIIESEDVSEGSASDSSDEIARKEALAILGIAEEAPAKEEVEESAEPVEDQTVAEEVETIELDDEDAAIQALLGEKDEAPLEVIHEKKAEVLDEEIKIPIKKKIALKPKAKIILGAKE